MQRLPPTDMDRLRVAMAVAPLVPRSIESAEEAMEYLKNLFPVRPAGGSEASKRVGELENEVKVLQRGMDARDIEIVRLKQEVANLKCAADQEGKGKKKKRKVAVGGAEERERRMGRLEALFAADRKGTTTPQPGVLSALRDVHTLLSDASPPPSPELVQRTFTRALHAVSALLSALIAAHTSPTSPKPEWLPPERKHPELIRALEGVLCGLLGEVHGDVRKWAEGVVCDEVLGPCVRAVRALSDAFLAACLAGKGEVDIRVPVVELVLGVMRVRKRVGERVGLDCLAELEALCAASSGDRQALLAAKDALPHLLSLLRAAVLGLSGDEGRCSFGRVVLERLGKVHGDIVRGEWAGRGMGRVVEDGVLGVVEIAWMRCAEAEAEAVGGEREKDVTGESSGAA